MMKHTSRTVAAVLAVLSLLAWQPAWAAQKFVPAGVVAIPMAVTPDVSAGMAYCKSTGGVVEVRKPVFGTNNPPSQQLVLAGSAVFCEYTLKKDGSRIHLLVTTLNATLPTLATLAYYAKVSVSKAPCPGGANPASCYCTYLGGSDQFGGANLAGGAWVGPGVDTDLEACVFPDMSSIDSWGLAYHSAGIIRGIDLAKVLRYHNKQ